MILFNNKSVQYDNVLPTMTDKLKKVLDYSARSGK